MDERRKVALLGSGGLIGQTYINLLKNHPLFDLVWMPKKDELKEVERAKGCDLIFSALPSVVAKVFDPLYAANEKIVFSSASCHRLDPKVPLIIPEINGDQIPSSGIVAKPNCTLQSSLLPLYPLHKRYRLKKVIVTNLQATSGAGRDFKLEGNILPFIEGEEEKSESETLKILGDLTIQISSHCTRVPVSHGHLAMISASFERSPDLEEIKEIWECFEGLSLPSAPKKLFRYFEEKDRPQPSLDVDVENGMGIALGRLRPCPVLDIRFTALSHNLIRGGAGGGLLTAEYWSKYASTLPL